MDRLLALPVRGDAFLYQRNNFYILIDGGSRGSTLARQLYANVPRLKVIDIAVCTHGDNDHSGGIATLLDDWPGKIGQFWLPGRWSDVVPALMTSAHEFVEALVEELLSLIRERPELNRDDLEVDDVERFFDGEASRELRPRNDDLRQIEEPADIQLERIPRVKEPEWMLELRERAREIAEHDSRAEKAFKSGKSRIYYRMRRRRASEALGRYWLSLIETAQNIRKIANQAVRHRIAIRWFDYGGFKDGQPASGGVSAFLIPVNAVGAVSASGRVSRPPALCNDTYSHQYREPCLLRTGKLRSEVESCLPAIRR